MTTKTIRRAKTVAGVLAVVAIAVALWLGRASNPDAQGVRHWQQRYPANAEAKNYR